MTYYYDKKLHISRCRLMLDLDSVYTLLNTDYSYEIGFCIK